MLSACDETSTTSTTVPLNDFNKTLTLQGKIMDATTGAGIGGADLQVFLIQGVSNRTPSKLISDPTNPLVGEYAFSDIPIAHLTNNTAYKVVAVKSGYQNFEGEFLFDANFVVGSPVDATYNWIGNIYLFPVGAQAGSLTVHVVNPVGKRILGATVLLRQRINSNNPVTGTTGGTSIIPGTDILADTTLTATNNLISSLTGTTDSAGTVVFAGSSLALGASYRPMVLPLTFDGQQLALMTGTDVIIGTDIAAQQIAMTDLEPNVAALYVVNTSNAVTGAVTGSGANAGVLTVVFNRPITLFNEPTFTATLSGAGPSAAVLTGSGTNTSVTASVSADGFTLTLTPQWTTAPVSTDKNLTITFVDAADSFYVQGLPTTTYRLFTAAGVDDITGGAISGAVNIMGP